MRLGIQITNKRLGKLEKEMLKFALEIEKNSLTYDLGGGNGYLSLILSLFHHQVYYYDLKPDWKLKFIKKILNLQKLYIFKEDFSKLKEKPKNQVKIIYSARALHYLQYKEMEKLFKKLSKILHPQGKIFITLTGLESEIGQKYPCKNNVPKERYCYLEKEYQKRFLIKEKITLLNLKEFQELVEKYFKIETIWESDFKNLFLIGSKKIDKK